jgi:hypothetical protein
VPQFHGRLETRVHPDILFSSFRFKVSRTFTPSAPDAIGPIVWSDLAFTGTGGDPALLQRLFAVSARIGAEKALEVEAIKLVPIDGDPLRDNGLMFKAVTPSGFATTPFDVSSVSPTTSGAAQFTLTGELPLGKSILDLWPCLPGAPQGGGSECPVGALPAWRPDPRPAVASIELESGAGAPLLFYSVASQPQPGPGGGGPGPLQLTAFRFTKTVDGTLSRALWNALHDATNLGAVMIRASGGVTYILANTHVTELEYVAEQLGGVPPTEHIALGFTKICIASDQKQTCFDVVTNTGSGGQP